MPVRVQVPSDEVPLHAGSDRGGDAGNNDDGVWLRLRVGLAPPCGPEGTAAEPGGGTETHV